MSKASLFTRTTAKLLISAAPAAIAMTAMPAAAQSTNAGTVNSISTGVGGTAPAFSGATSNTSGADTSTITLGASHTILNWDGFNLNAGDTLNYVFGANNWIALNRVDGASAATINGAIFGKIGSTVGASGGNIWFLAPGGVIVNSTGSINAGGILLSSGNITDSDFFASNFNFLDASNNITVTSGASLTASNGALTLIAPSISFHGNAVASGSIALVGAKDVSVVFDGDMDAYVALTIAEGSGASVAVDVGANASFNAAAPASGGKTYIVAAGDGVGLGSVLIGGTAANRVEFDQGDVVLYAAGNVTTPKSIISGGALQGLGSATGGGDVTVGAINVDSGSLDVRAVDDVIVNEAVSVPAGNVRLESGSDLTVNTAVSVGGDYTIRADDWFGGAVFNPNEGGDINIQDTAGGLSIGNVTATDDLRITTENGQLTITGPVTAGTGNIHLTTTGANAGAGHNLVLQGNVVDTGSDDSVVLSASGNIVQSSGVVTTASLSATAANGIGLNQANLIGTFANLQSDFGSIDARSDVSGGVLIGDVDSGNGSVTLRGANGLRLVGGTSDIDAPSGAIMLYGPATVSGAVALSGAGVWFSSTVDGASAGSGALTINTSGVAEFSGNVGATNALSSLTVQGGRTILYANTLRAGTVQLADMSVSASGTVNLTATSGNLTVGNITAAATGTALRLGAPSGLITTGSIGSSASPFGSVNVLNNARLNGGVFANGAVVYGGTLTLSDGDHDIIGSSVTFNGAVNGTNAGSSELFVRANAALNGADPLAGMVDFNAAIGGSTALGGLAVVGNQAEFTGTNNVGTLAASIGNGGLSFTSGSALTIGTVTVTPNSGPSYVTSGIAAAGPINLTTTSGNMLLNAGTYAGTSAVTLNAAGSISGAGLITGGNVSLTGATGIGSSGARVNTAADTLSVSGGSGAVFVSEADAVTLSGQAATRFDVTAAGSITTNGGVTAAGGDVVLAATNGGDISLGANLSAGGGGDIYLSAGGTLSSGIGVALVAEDLFLTAQNFTGTILDAATLQETDDLSITDTAGGLTVVGLSAADALSIITTNGGSLEVQGAAAGGDITLTSGANLTLTGAVDATNSTLAISAVGNVSQTVAGTVTAGTLTGSAGGSATLTNASNSITNLGALSANGLTIADSGGLTIAGALNGGAGGVGVTTSGNLTVNADVSATGGTIALSATGSGSDIAINNAGGIGSGSAHLSLTAAGDISVAGTAKGIDVAMNAGGALSTAAITARDDIALRATGSVATGALTSGATVDALGAVDASGSADSLTGATLAGNDIDLSADGVSVGAIRANGGGSDVRINGGASGIGSGSQDLDIAAGGNVVLTGSARGREVALSAGGTMTAGTITARDDIALRATGSISTGALTSGATVDALAAVDTAGAADTLIGATLAGNDIDISGNGAVVGAVRANGVGSDARLNGGAAGIGSGSQDLDVTAGGNVALTGSARGRDVALNAGGTVTTGSITARDDIVVRSTGAATTGALTSGTTVDALGAVDTAGAADTLAGATLSGQDIDLRGANVTFASANSNGSGSDVAAQATSGTVNAGAASAAGDVRYQSSGNLALTNAVTAAGTLTLVSGGSISQSAAISAQTLTGSSTSATTLNHSGNQIANLGAFTAGSLSLVDNGSLAITGVVNTGSGNTTIRTSGGNLTVASTGGLTGAEIVLSTDQAFVNNSGSDAIAASNRWLVYSAAPDGNTYGGLDSGNTAVWNATYATVAPSSISGSRYVFAYQPTLTFTSLDESKVYGTALTGSAYSVTGFHAGVAGAFLGDTAGTAFSGSPLMSSAGYVGDADVAGGPYAIGIATGSLTSLTGYAFSFNGAGKLTITPKAITGTVVADDKTYDGTTTATGTVTLDGVLLGDDVTGSAILAFIDANAGSDKTVTVSSGALSGSDASNYTLTLPASVLADIFKKALTGIVVVDDKTYDGTTAATGTITLDGVVTGDDVTAAAILAFADANAGSDKTVTISGASLSGADAGNYTLTLPASVVADIFKKAITGTVVADDKTYDGTTSASGTITLNGVIAGDQVTASAILAFADANAGSDKVVFITSASLSGADAGNYTLTLPASVLADIFKRALTGIVVVDNKTYDGTTSATGTITLDGLVAGDDVTASAIMAFADANAGSGKIVTISGGSLSGADAGNYTLTLPASVLADIFRAAITIAADSLTKGHGTDDPALTYTIAAGELFGDDQLTGSLARASGELPGDYAILQGSLAASSNYEITFVPGVLTIEPQIVFRDDLGGLLSLYRPIGPGNDADLLILDERDCDQGNAGKSNQCSIGGRE